MAVKALVALAVLMAILPLHLSEAKTREVCWGSFATPALDKDSVASKTLSLPHRAYYRSNTSVTPYEVKQVSVEFHFVYPKAYAQGQSSNKESCHKPPVILVMPGFAVGGSNYVDLQKLLAGLGYVSAVANYRRYPPFYTPGTENISACFPLVTWTSSRLVNTLYDWSQGQAANKFKHAKFLKPTAWEKIIVVGHSSGGINAAMALFSIAGDWCTKLSATNPFVNLQCEGYHVQNSSKGINIVKGVVVFEGGFSPVGLSGGPMMLSDVVPVTTPNNGAFLHYMNGQYGDVFRLQYANTTSTCKFLTSFNRMNHYGITNFVKDPDAHQRTECSGPAGSPIAPNTFNTTEDLQNAGLRLIARTTHATITGVLRGSRSAKRFLIQQLPEDARVDQAEASKSCLMS